MKLDQILKGSYQRYRAADFLATKFFNKRIALVVDGASEDDIPNIKDRLLDAYGDVEVTLEKDGEDKLAKVSDIHSALRACDRSYRACGLQAF